MSRTTEIAENDLKGLPDVINRTLLAHPTWAVMSGKIVCAGKDCDWVKPSGKSTKQRSIITRYLSSNGPLAAGMTVRMRTRCLLNTYSSCPDYGSANDRRGKSM